MNISYRWLQALAPGLDASPVEVADRLAAYGAPADEIVDIAANLRDVVIARVVEALRHPNADRLSLCTVDAGGPEPLSVVCGAPNVKAGAFYPFAPVGAALPNGVKIRKAKIRGETSEGMLCSAAELGLGRDHSGILELRGTFVPGELFAGALGLDDARIVLDITPNRGDLLSHIGVARELAGSDVRLPPLPGAGDAGRRMAIEGDTAGTIRIRIDDTDGCPRYLAAFIRGVKVGPSPAWLDARLRAIGQRPINNVVDATNYILHELGQPLHAFDAARLGGEQIIVRRAGAGEMLRTLDGIERKLDPSMLVIADGSVPVALAGIMGGQDSEVTDDTVDVLLECALFDPATTRRTRNALGLSTDASYRFERGVDPEGMETALRRAVDLIVAVAGGTADGAAHVGAEPRPRRTIVLRESRVEQVLGVPFTTAQLAELLAPIGFDVDARDAESITVRVPGFRSYDVMREDDLVEEVARRHGYDEFPVELRPFRVGALEDHPVSRLEDRLRTLLVAEGFFETRSVPFVGEKEGDVALLLPLASNESRLRRTLLNTLIHRLEYNFARGIGDVRLFELGTVFAPGEPGELPREATHLGAVFTGARAPEHWSTRTEPFDVFDLKALGELLGDALELEMQQA
ncbi:MAG: phenylalanine--tRNA ligase subunit beta, partial [Candidatus Cloacimonetes bacterium]|nr:phenylalanine--tRNA ligase subunit beta [Candidatus Cloacimonadota bacterium]